MTIDQKKAMYECIKQIEVHCSEIYAPQLKQLGIENDCALTVDVSGNRLSIYPEGLILFCTNGHEYSLNYKKYSVYKCVANSIYNEDYANCGPINLVIYWKELKPQIEEQISNIRTKFNNIQSALDNFVL